MGAANAAVQAVGHTFFLVTISLYFLSSLAMWPAVILGTKSRYFDWEMDRCTCVVDVASQDACVFGEDYVKVNIGWQKYTMDEIQYTVGCPEAEAAYAEDPELLKETLDDPQTFNVFEKEYNLDGVFQKTDNPTQADEKNGAAAAGGAVVGMQVICAFFALFTCKMLKASYLTNGSHCSIGLGLVTKFNALISLATIAVLLSFWWLIEGRFGDEDSALTAALQETMFNECWSETTQISRCPVRPWDFTGPGLALWCGIGQVAAFSLCTLYMLWKAPIVEGILDGSMDPTGAMLKPRVVEVEIVVGKALATDGDPDYDSENPLYNGAATMIRPYPLPKTAKAVKNAAVIEGEDGDEVMMVDGHGAESDTASSEYESKSDPGIPDDQMSAMHSEYNGQTDLEMIVEESEEDQASSRYSEARYSAASGYSDTYSDYGDRPARGGHGRMQHQMAPSR